MGRMNPAYVWAAGTGAVLWTTASLMGGRREAFDAPVYWQVAYPLALCVAAVLGYLAPERPGRWATTLFLGQFVAMAVMAGEISGLWPLSIVVFLMMSAPAVATARLGGWIRRRNNGPLRT